MEQRDGWFTISKDGRDYSLILIANESLTIRTALHVACEEDANSRSVGILVSGKANMAARNKMVDTIGDLVRLISRRVGTFLHKYMTKLDEVVEWKKEF